jgi:hypothetical protein
LASAKPLLVEPPPPGEERQAGGRPRSEAYAASAGASSRTTTTMPANELHMLAREHAITRDDRERLEAGGGSTIRLQIPEPAMRCRMSFQPCFRKKFSSRRNELSN